MEITKELIEKLDPGKIYESVLSFPKQIQHAAEIADSFDLPNDYRRIKNVVVTGMGGSALGARMIDSLEYEILKVPLEIVNDYHLPAYVDENTLVITSSYSGTTEETLSGYEEARKQKAKLLTVSTGGKLADLAKKDGVPSFVYKPVFNSSHQPRLAIGYNAVLLMMIMAKLDLIILTSEQIKGLIKVAEKSNQQYKIESTDNQAILLAKKLEGRIPILIAAEHLFESTHTTKNQINENAKTFSAHFSIPELNHHLMEGLGFPKTNKDILLFVFYVSDLYHQRIKERFELTLQLIKKFNIPTFVFTLQSTTKLEQVFEAIQFGNFYSFYLAMVNGVNPEPIPTVDWFKERLENSCLSH